MDKKIFLNRMANNIEIIESHIGCIESIFLTKDYAQIISEKVNLKYNFQKGKLEVINFYFPVDSILKYIEHILNESLKEKFDLEMELQKIGCSIRGIAKIKFNGLTEKYAIEEKIERLIKKENENLKKVNEFQKAKILAYESGEKDKLIKESQKEINYLYGQIESLQEQIKNIEQDENNTIEENIIIEEIEQQEEKEKTDLQNKNIIVLGGKWNSKNRGEVESYIDFKNATVEFIEANRIFRNSEKIKNKDIVIFDTSFNSHAAYYKVKSITENLIYINKSNIEEIKKSL